MAKRGYGRNKQICQAGPPAINFHLKYAIKDGSSIDCRGSHHWRTDVMGECIVEKCSRCPAMKVVQCLSS